MPAKTEKHERRWHWYLRDHDCIQKTLKADGKLTYYHAGAAGEGYTESRDGGDPVRLILRAWGHRDAGCHPPFTHGAMHLMAIQPGSDEIADAVGVEAVFSLDEFESLIHQMIAFKDQWAAKLAKEEESAGQD